MHLAAMNRTGSQVLQLFRRFAESHKKENVSHGYLRLDMPPSHIENALHSSLEFAETSVNHVRIDSGHCIVDCRFQFHQSLGLLRISERLQKSPKEFCADRPPTLELRLREFSWDELERLFSAPACQGGHFLLPRGEHDNLRLTLVQELDGGLRIRFGRSAARLGHFSNGRTISRFWQALSEKNA